jgi:undecaprenyl-diphosphatase
MSRVRKVAAVAVLAVFGWMAVVVAMGTLLPFDLPVRNAVHAYASPARTAAMVAFTDIGSAPALLAIGALVVAGMLQVKRWRTALWFAGTTLGGEGLSEFAKLLFQRPRPAPYFGTLLPGSYSFPSGHSFMGVCFFGALAFLLTSRLRSPAARVAIWAGAAILATLIGLSRIYLGVHYPSDVLGGFTLAGVWLLGCAHAVEK